MPPPSTLQIGDDLLPCPATPPRSQPPRTRDNQKVIPRTGAHFLTPQKRRLGGKKDQVLEIPVQEPSDASPPAKRSKRLLPDAEAHKTFDRWHIVPATFNLVHSGRTVLRGLVLQHPRSEYLVLVLEPIPQVLVHHGLFPVSPSHPRTTVSIDLLEFYHALFERSADAVTALAGALRTHYARRGFQTLDHKGDPIRDPFRRGLGYATQWYDTLRHSIQHCLDAAIDAAHACLAPDPIDTLVDNHDAHALSTPPPVDALTRCARLLSTRCPACFGEAAFGRPFDEGADIHVALDATFSQRHSMHAGDSPHFYEPEFFIPKAQVDECGRRIIAARNKPPRPSCAPKVPAHIVDECEKSYEAADEKKVKTSANRFNDTGVMALICRHDIPIFLANIDTPGEQQKYAIALLEHLFTFLPPNATVAAL
ncbi:predicted protein, partial [Postia placenta Mad-698-R]